MATVLVTAQLTTQELMEAIGQLDRVELEKVARHVTRLRTRKPTGLAVREAELLKTARRRLPRPFLSQYRALIQKRQTQTLTAAEYQELLRMGAEAENFQVARLQALAELAALRKTDLDILRQDLGIEPERL